jgi:hypothetical protein
VESWWRRNVSKISEDSSTRTPTLYRSRGQLPSGGTRRISLQKRCRCLGIVVMVSLFHHFGFASCGFEPGFCPLFSFFFSIARLDCYGGPVSTATPIARRYPQCHAPTLVRCCVGVGLGWLVWGFRDMYKKSEEPNSMHSYSFASPNRCVPEVGGRSSAKPRYSK